MSPTELQTLFEQLPASEQARANAYRHPASRSAFIVMRAALRALLGLHLPSNSPTDLEIGISSQGKPFLVHQPGLKFNLSHSQQRGLIGISTHTEIGIDIEIPNLRRNLSGIAKHFFSPQEIAFFEQTPTPLVFYQIWTAKEALLKCTGTGLANHMQQVSNLPTDNGKMDTDASAISPAPFSVYSLTDLYDASNAVAAVAWQA